MINSHSSYVNTKEILYSLICRYQPISRSDIADIAGLTRASVSNIVKQFLEVGLVVESDKIGGNVGRKKVLLRVNEQSIHVIGVDVGRRNITSTIYNAGGKILRTERCSFSCAKGLHENIEDAKKILNKLLTWANVKGIEIDAIGIGVPGPVDHNNGIVYSAPHFQKSEIINIKKILEKTYKIPTFVERDANAAALGEQCFGIGKKYNSFIYLLLVEGIGAGMIIDGYLYRGSHGLAGKVGRFVFPKIGDGGEIHILEEFGSEISALNIAEENAKKIRTGYLNNIIKKRLLNINDLIDAFKKKDPVAIEVVNIMAYHTAIAVSNLVLFADPKLIILGGDFINVGPYFVNEVREKVKKILGKRPLPDLRESPIYDLAISLGAATRAISEVVSQKLKEV